MLGNWVVFYTLLLIISTNGSALADTDVGGAEYRISREALDREIRKCGTKAEQKIGKCLEPILSYASSLQQGSDEDTSAASQQPQQQQQHFSLKGGTAFKDLCRLYADFQECTRSVKCDSISLRAVDASYGYMCGRGYSLFEEHAECFAEVEGQPEYLRCKHSAGQALDSTLQQHHHLQQQQKSDAASGGLAPNEYLHELCHVMEDYLRCCRPHVHHHCGAEAWQLVSQITLDSLRVTMPSCDVHIALMTDYD